MSSEAIVSVATWFFRVLALLEVIAYIMFAVWCFRNVRGGIL